MNPKHCWVDSELEKLKKDFPHRKTRIVAAEMGLNYHVVTKKAYQIGLKKTDSFLNSPEGNRLDGKRGSEYRFKKGNVSYNKGITMSPEVRENLKHTWFKSGHKPHNTKYDGYERISKDGYRVVRIRYGKFVFLHRKN